jgi:hypothetical protein
MLANLHAIVGAGYVIKIVKKRTRGRPKKLHVLTGPALVGTLDEVMEEYRQNGLTERQARKRAFADAKAELEREDSDGHLLANRKRRSLEMATIERYYRAGIRELRDCEMRLAAEIDKISAAHGREGPMPEYGDYGAGGIISRRYRRGKRALSAARRKQEK